MKKELGLITLLFISMFSSADWLDVNMPVGVTDISQDVFWLTYAYVLDYGSHWCSGFWRIVLCNVEI